MALQHDAWIEVDRAALRDNHRAVAQHVGVDIIAVVKANAYGHGAVEAAQVFVESGARMLGVTHLWEALELRAGGLMAPILVMAPILPENAPEAVASHGTCMVQSAELGRALSDAATRAGTVCDVHVKVDTGMGRLGAPPGDVVALMGELVTLPGLRASGVFTHFARAADRDLAPALHQLGVFEGALAALRASGHPMPMAHAANSAAALRLARARFDAVRIGTLLYGQYPTAHVPREVEVRNTWSLKSRVIAVRRLAAGSAVGYGADETVRRPTVAAVLPVGFADGFTLAPEGPIYRQGLLRFAVGRARRQPSVQIGSQTAPVLGRVSMQLTVVDVTDISGVEVGSEAVVPVSRLAASSRLPRVYIN